MWYRLLPAVFFVVLTASAQSLSVKQLVSFIQSSVQMKQSDKEVSGYLSKAKLTEKLDDRTIEDLQGLGIGPKTLAALKALRDQSQSLSAAEPVSTAKPAPKPPPSSEDQAAIIDDARKYALSYSKTLPDYICTQVVRRYAAAAPGTRYGGRAGSDPSWQLMNTLTIKLTYFDQKEDYKLILVNNTVAQSDYHRVGGTTSTGDFGSMMREIFEPATETRFEWDHWAKMRGHPTYVFNYRVTQARSQWHVSTEDQSIVVAYRGLIYVDQDTRQVLRVTLEADDIMPGFPVKHASDILDYDYQELGGQQFLLPFKGEVRIDNGQVLTRNENEFRMYNKFSSQSEIKYDTDTPAPIPEDQTKEQPLTSPPH